MDSRTADESDATEPAPAIVRVDAISKRFVSAEGAPVTALDAVSLSVAAGRFTTLLGPSGCGKTTLLRAIGGFEAPDEGRVLIDGRDMTHEPPFARPVNTVFQHYALFPHMSVADNVAYGLQAKRVARSDIGPRVERALALVRLPGLGGRRISQLSGGQQQRVALARSLVLQPKILLLDEPLAALDRQLRKDMQVELKRLQNEVGVAFLCVTHDQEEALSMSDEVVVMNDGRIEQTGSPREIYERPATRFAAGFVGEASMLSCRVAGRGGGATRLELADGQTLTSAEAGDAVGARIAVLRPERLRLARPADALPHLAAVVRESVYLGDKVRLVADCAGERLSALLDGAVEPPAPGETVSLAYDPAHVRTVSP